MENSGIASLLNLIRRSRSSPLAILQFDVTTADIDRGMRFSTTHCPIALALLRRHPEFCEVSVGKYEVLVLRCLTNGAGGTRQSSYYYDEYQFDDMTRSKNLAFDFGEDVAPFRARLIFVRRFPTDPPTRHVFFAPPPDEIDVDAVPATVTSGNLAPAPQPPLKQATVSARAAAQSTSPATSIVLWNQSGLQQTADDEDDNDGCGDLLRLIRSTNANGDFDSFEANDMGKQDLTSLLERMDDFEERAGVRLEALSAFFDDDGSAGSWCLTVCGELWTANGDRLPHNVDVSFAIYDGQSRVVATAEHQIQAADFHSFQPFEIAAFVPVNRISKIRLLTKRSAY